MVSPLIGLLAQAGPSAQNKAADALSAASALEANPESAFARLMASSKEAGITAEASEVAAQELKKQTLPDAGDIAASPLMLIPLASLPEQQTTAALNADASYNVDMPTDAAGLAMLPTAGFTQELETTTATPADIIINKLNGYVLSSAQEVPQEQTTSPQPSTTVTADGTPNDAELVTQLLATHTSVPAPQPAPQSVPATHTDAAAATLVATPQAQAQAAAVAQSAAADIAETAPLPSMEDVADITSLTALFVSNKYATAETRPANKSPVTSAVEKPDKTMAGKPSTVEQMLGKPTQSTDGFLTLMDQNFKPQAAGAAQPGMADTVDISLPGYDNKGTLPVGTQSGGLHTVDGTSRGYNTSSEHHFNRLLNPGAHVPVSEQVLVKIRGAVADGSSQIRIELDPAELGRVEVKMDVAADGKTGLIITADNRDALDALQRDAKMLERMLNDAGLKTDSGSLNFQMRGDQQKGFGQSAYNNGHFNAPFGDDNNTQPLPAAVAHYALVRDGGVNIQV